MAGTEIHALTLSELAALLKARDVSPVEATQATLARIEQLEPELHAFATVLPEAALESARQAEEEIGRGGYRGTLHGVPVGVKDLCAIKGVRTASGTRVMSDRQPDHTATVVERLEGAGAVILGKTQLTEGAYGWPSAASVAKPRPSKPGTTAYAISTVPEASGGPLNPADPIARPLSRSTKKKPSCHGSALVLARTESNHSSGKSSEAKKSR